MSVFGNFWDRGRVQVEEKFVQQRIEYSGGEVRFLGRALPEENTSGCWIISRLSYTLGSVTHIQTASGAWDDRASLFS